MKSESDGLVERLRVAAKAAGSATKLCEMSGVPLRTFNDYLAGGKVPVDRLVVIADAVGFSVEWLAAGRGEQEAKRERLPARRAGFSIHKPDDDYVLIPRFDIRAAAGAGAFVQDEDILDYMAFQREWVRNELGVDPADLALLSADGDSMEPTIRTRDLLLVDRSVRAIRDDSIYVILWEGQLMLKRLQRLGQGAVAIRSDNPAYAEVRLSPDQADQLGVAGRLRWIARRL